MPFRTSASPSHPSIAHGASTKSKAPQTPPLQITIVVMGATGSGKTSFINMASGSSPCVASSLEPCAAEVQLANEFVLDRRPILLFETPGFGDNNKSNTDILKSIAAFLATTYEAGSTFAGIIYIHRISDKRFSGVSGLNFRMFRGLCGDKSLRNVVLVTNMWGEVTSDVGEAHEQELASNLFKPVLDRGAQLARHRNTVQSAYDIIRSIMKNRPLPLQIQHELVDQGKDITHTSAGEVMNRELNEQMRRHQEELKAVQEDMIQALKEKDEETRQELEQETRKLQEQMKKVRAASANMASDSLEENRKTEERMKRTQEGARLERERAAAEYKKRMDELDRQLAERATPSTIAGEGPVQQRKRGNLLFGGSATPITQPNTLARHSKFYIDDRKPFVTFIVEGKLFRVHRYLFELESEVFRSMFEIPQGEDTVEGGTDELPIILPSVSVAEMEALLNFFYFRQALDEAKFSEADWCNLLSISHRYECERARERSVKEINSLNPPVNNVDKIAMAKRFGVEEWLVPAYVALVERREPLTCGEAEKLGLGTTVLLGEAREKFIQRRQSPTYHSYNSYSRRPNKDTAQLVKDILHIN